MVPKCNIPEEKDGFQNIVHSMKLPPGETERRHEMRGHLFVSFAVCFRSRQRMFLKSKIVSNTSIYER